MVKTGAIYFWLSGTIAPSVPGLLRQALAELGKPDENLLGHPGFASLCEALALGRASPRSFCGTIAEMVGLTIKAELLEGKILKHIEADTRALKTIDRLPEVYERWLVVDYPPAWFEAAAERMGVRRFFQSDRIIKLAECGLEQLMPDAVDYLARKPGIPPAERLLIDVSHRRAIQALRSGMHAAIYVDPRRLEREFTMRYLIPGSQPIHQPGGSV